MTHFINYPVLTLPTEQVERYDPLSGVWTVVKPMLTRRCRLGVATLNGKMYVCGGYDGSTFLQSVEVYDPVTDTLVSKPFLVQ